MRYINVFQMRLAHNTLCKDQKQLDTFLYHYMFIERQTHGGMMTIKSILTQLITNVTVLIVTFLLILTD